MEHSGFRFFQLEKNPLLSRNLGVLVDQKGSPIFFFFNMKLRWNKIIEIWNIPDSNFSNWKKIHFCPEIWGKILEKKLLWFCSKLAQMRFKQYKFILIWNIPNSDFSNYIGKKSNLSFWRSDKFSEDFPYKIFIRGFLQ